MTESDFWQRRIKPTMQYCNVWAERIENGVMPGMPDVTYAFKHIAQGWIELKFRADPPVKSQTTVFGDHHGLRKEQIAWWLNYLNHGYGLLLAGVGKDNYAFRATPGLVRSFNSFTLNDFHKYAQSFNTLSAIDLLKRDE